MERLLVATDGSDGAGRAVDFAARLASAPNAHLMIVNVVGMQSLPEAVLSQFTRTQHAWMQELLASFSARILRDARDRAVAAGAAGIQLETRDGEVAQMIVDAASQLGADVIVVGRRGSGRIAGLLLGSVSQKLVTISSIPVLVVP